MVDGDPQCVKPDTSHQNDYANWKKYIPLATLSYEDGFDGLQDAVIATIRNLGVLLRDISSSLNWIQWAILAIATLSVLMIFGRIRLFISNLFQHRFSDATLRKLDVDDIQLLIRRSQYRTFPLRRVKFRVDVRAYLTPESWALVRKYGLRNHIVYGSQSFYDLDERAVGHIDFADALNAAGKTFNPLRFLAIFNALWLSAASRFALKVRVKHLLRGKKIKSKDLFEIVGVEDTSIKACKSLHNMLIRAETYDGRELIYNMSEVEIKDSDK